MFTTQIKHYFQQKYIKRVLTCDRWRTNKDRKICMNAAIYNNI